MIRARSIRAGLAAAGAALALLAASCAPVPAPVPTPVPPSAPVPGVPAPAPGPYRLDREPTLDVGLGTDLDTLTLAPGRAAEIVLQSGGGSGGIGSTAGAIVAKAVAPGWSIEWSGASAARSNRTLAASDTIWIDSGGSSPGAPGIRWQGKTWRGRLKIFLGPRGRLTLASRLPLETYLLGVVPAEIGGLAADLLEAGRAQAIAARSYTLFYRGRRASEGFDLFGSVEDQVYGSIENERPLATRCVETTRGVVAVASSGPIRANYSSTCGGITADVWEAWPAAPISYLVGHRDRGAPRDYCAESPHYRWREEWSAAEFLANLATYGPPEGIAMPALGPGDLLDVRVTSRSRSGRVWRLEVRTSSGRYEVSGHALRRVLRRPGNPRAILRSNLVKIDVRRDPATRRAIGVVASGAGSGHGVGLCQTGAIGMARAKIAADHILLHYYEGIEVKRFY